LRRKGFILGCLRRPERVDSISKALGKRVEAYAVMGRVHPFFEKGGMNRHDPPGGGDGPVYYLFDSREMRKE